MGRSSSKLSCFHIIACGGDVAEKPDIELTESKASIDKRRWSFSKRSGRHRVLSSSVISELPPAAGKECVEGAISDLHLAGTNETLEAVSNDLHSASLTESVEAAPNDIHSAANKESLEDFHGQINFREKSVRWADVTPQVASVEVDSESPVALLVNENDSDSDSNLQESVAIILQAAIRGYLAQKALLKQKSAVKLQALIRGHLVRRQAVGTLRCVQAIVKIQALVRARRVHLSADTFRIQNKHSDSINTNHQREKENLGVETNANATFSSSQKLIISGFARQLLDSTPKKRVHFTCDPLKPDSTWQWLERWMSFSLEFAQEPKSIVEEPNYQDLRHEKLTATEVEAQALVENISNSADVEPEIEEKILLDSEDNLLVKNVDDSGIQGERFTNEKTSDNDQPLINAISSPSPVVDRNCPPMKDDINLSQPAESGLEVELIKDNGNSLDEASDYHSNQITVESNATTVAMLDLAPNITEADTEISNHTMKSAAHEQLETESKKYVIGLRKSANPAFAAVHSKFEELSSKGNSDQRLSPTCHDVSVEFYIEVASPQIDSMPTNKNISGTKSLIMHDERLQAGGSEDGTKCSISSSQNLSDISTSEGQKFLPETGTDCNGDSFPNGICHESLLAEAEKPTFNSEVLPISSKNGLVVPEKAGELSKEISDSLEHESYNKNVEEQVTSENIVQETQNVDSLVHISPVKEETINNLSRGGSPKSHVTASGSSDKPCNQVNTQSGKLDNLVAAQKRKSHSISKMPVRQQNDGSHSRNNVDHVPKDPKNGKRRSSLDQEPRVTGVNSLPNYMQPTESARAKVQTGSSPKSSPDMHDKDIYIRKRHSLPGINGTQSQVSPQMQRSISQAQQSSGANDTHSPQNVPGKRWQR